MTQPRHDPHVRQRFVCWILGEPWRRIRGYVQDTVLKLGGGFIIGPVWMVVVSSCLHVCVERLTSLFLLRDLSLLIGGKRA